MCNAISIFQRGDRVLQYNNVMNCGLVRVYVRLLICEDFECTVPVDGCRLVDSVVKPTQSLNEEESKMKFQKRDELL